MPSRPALSMPRLAVQPKVHVKPNDTRNSSGDGIPEHDVTSSYLFTYLPLNYK